ncbi:MAG: virulence protein E [Burkholderiaceae bacterium]|nr:virulence protein E [Burkholderiaceae bacterium]
MQSNTPLPPIRFAELAAALLQSAARLVPAWLPEGVVRGHEYICGSLSGGHGSSCSINLTTGRWADFSTDEQGGDLLSLYAAIHGLSQAKAALQVARAEGLEQVAGIVGSGYTALTLATPAPPPPAVPAPAGRLSEEGWRTVAPVPAVAPKPTFRHQARSAQDIEHTATYRVGDDLYGYVVRFRTRDGGKDTLPYTWCESARDGAARWHWRQWDAPRPLYMPGQRVPDGKTVVLVEGERKADTLQALLDVGVPGVYCVASWPGGCKTWNRADWSWLAGSVVLLWPDCDAKRIALTAAERKATPDKLAQQVLLQAKPLLPPEKQPGMAAMLGIGALLQAQYGCQVQLLPIPLPSAVADGWDCHDAIVADGWGVAEVLAFFATAQALPTESPAAAPAGTKIEAPVATEGADSGPNGQAFGLIGDKWIVSWLRPYYDLDKSRWLVSRKLVIKALQHDPALAGVPGFNELTNNVQARYAWPWPHGRAGDVGNAVDLLLGQYLTDTYGLPSIPRASLSEAIITVANMQRWHPIREFLQVLQWDGTSRIDKWLVHVLGESPETLGPAMQEYLGLVGRYWLLGMVNRVMRPGCKFDYCPVLEGAGGLRKSTLVEVLAGSEYFSDTPFEVGNGKEAQEQVQGLWLYEIAELTHFSKSEVGAIKAFISSKADRYRVAYGSTVETFPRQCILVGTTNENTYLRDRTGNRRFWPIPVRNVINTDWVAKYRAQLLAEAFALYQLGASYTPTPVQEARLFAPMQESRLQESAVEVELMTILTRPPGPTGSAAEVNELTDFVMLPQLVQALNVDVGKSTKGLQLEITGWLGHEGWVHGKRQIGGVRKSGYTRPANWPAQAGSDMQASSLPPGAGTTGSTTTQAGDDAPF